MIMPPKQFNLYVPRRLMKCGNAIKFTQESAKSSAVRSAVRAAKRMPAVSVSSEEATNQISGADLHPNHLGAMSTVPYINESDFATDEEKYPASLCSSTAALLSQEAVSFEWSNDTLAEPFKGDKVIQFHKAADMVDYYYLLDLEDCSVSSGKFEHADKQIR